MPSQVVCIYVLEVKQECYHFASKIVLCFVVLELGDTLLKSGSKKSRLYHFDPTACLSKKYVSLDRSFTIAKQ